MTQYQPGPGQMSSRRQIILVILAVVLLAYPAFQLFLFGYTGARLLIASQETHEVVYKVSGTAKEPVITYGDKTHAHTEELSGVGLPWESGKVKTKGANQVLSLSARQQVGDRGTVRCEIWVDGKLVESNDPENIAPGLSLSARCLAIP